MSMADTGNGLEVFAKLSLSLDGLASEQRALRNKLAATPPQPVYRRLSTAGVYPSSGVLAINLGGPDMGTRWSLLSTAVGGVTPGTAAAGRADLFVSAVAPVDGVNSGQPGSPGWVAGTGVTVGAFSFWRDDASSLPLPAFYGPDQISVNAGEDLWFVFASGTAGQVYVANGVVQETRTDAYRSENPI